MLSFSVIALYSKIEIGQYSLFEKKAIAAFKLNKKHYKVLALVSEKKKTMICLSQAKLFSKSHHFV